jgi:hypothetical protein
MQSRHAVILAKNPTHGDETAMNGAPEWGMGLC